MHHRRKNRATRKEAELRAAELLLLLLCCAVTAAAAPAACNYAVSLRLRLLLLCCCSTPADPGGFRGFRTLDERVTRQETHSCTPHLTPPPKNTLFFAGHPTPWWPRVELKGEGRKELVTSAFIHKNRKLKRKITILGCAV